MQVYICYDLSNMKIAKAFTDENQAKAYCANNLYLGYSTGIELMDHKIARLEEAVYYASMWQCPKCGFYSMEGWVCHHCGQDPSEK